MMDGEVSSYLRGCNSILNSYQDIEDSLMDIKTLTVGSKFKIWIISVLNGVVGKLIVSELPG